MNIVQITSVEGYAAINLTVTTIFAKNVVFSYLKFINYYKVYNQHYKLEWLSV